MTVCYATSIALEEQSLAWFGPENACWRVPLDTLKVIGELTTDSMAEGRFLAVVTDTTGGWFQAPWNAIGLEQVLAGLERRFQSSIRPVSAGPSRIYSRVLWPEPLAGREMFELREEAPHHRSRAGGRLLLHPRVLAHVAGHESP